MAKMYIPFFLFSCLTDSQITFANFSKFIKKFCSENHNDLNMPQSHWFLKGGELNVDFVGSLESSESDLSFIFNKLSLSKTIPQKKINESEFNLTKDIYTQELIDLVAEKEADVIKLKNYTF